MLSQNRIDLLGAAGALRAGCMLKQILCALPFYGSCHWNPPDLEYRVHGCNVCDELTLIRGKYSLTWTDNICHPFDKCCQSVMSDGVEKPPPFREAAMKAQALKIRRRMASLSSAEVEVRAENSLWLVLD